MDMTRRSFLGALGLGAAALTLPKQIGLVEPIIQKVGPPPVNAGFARAIFPKGFAITQFRWAAESACGFDFKLFLPNKEKAATNLMTMTTPDPPCWMNTTGAFYTFSNPFFFPEKSETLEFWIKSHSPDKLAPNIHMYVTGWKEDVTHVIEVPIRRVRLDHGWALKHGVIRPDEPPATYEETEEDDEKKEDESDYAYS